MARITKREQFVAILAVLEGTDNADLIEFVKGEISTLDKRKSAPRKPTSTQRENAMLKEDIVFVLSQTNTAVRATDVANSLGLSVQRVTALLRQLVEAKTVIRETNGKVVTFRV